MEDLNETCQICGAPYKTAGDEEMCPNQKRIERVYQISMDLRDSKRVCIDFCPIEREYTSEYLRAFNKNHDIAAFRVRSREYRDLLTAYGKH